MNYSSFRDFKEHSLSTGGAECCGIVVSGPERYIPCKNIAVKGDEFGFDPAEWCMHNVLAFCHSHPGKSCRPTASDILGCEHVGKTYMIIGQDGLWRLDPRSYREKLLGRDYLFGWSDCWTLIRDYFGADMMDVPREKEDSELLYNNHYRDFGWENVDINNLQKDDVIFFGIDHAAVYLGEGLILQHKTGRLSRVDHFNYLMIKSVSRILRRVK